MIPQSIVSRWGYGVNNPGAILPLDEDAGCIVSMGEPIVKKGLSGASLPGFVALDWDKFPESREFKIRIDDFDGNVVCYSKTGSINCDSFKPEGDVTVRSFDWIYNILNKDYEYSPVLITIMVW